MRLSEKGVASMVHLMKRHPGGHTAGNSPGIVADRSGRPDWRGWIGLAWVVFWGWAYVLMAFNARSPQIVHWIRTLTGSAK
jgi:hypothetical protein